MNRTFELSSELGARLRERGLSVTTVESCTGGLVAGAITEVPGSSEWFRAGFVTYANEAKVRLAQVPAGILEAHGAVSEETVRAMAEGALEPAAADVAVAISGIAGPGGEVPGKPVGTVWIAVARRGGATVAACHRFEGDRAQVRAAAVNQALRATLSIVEITGS